MSNCHSKSLECFVVVVPMSSNVHVFVEMTPARTMTSHEQNAELKRGSREKLKKYNPMLPRSFFTSVWTVPVLPSFWISAHGIIDSIDDIVRLG